MIKSDPLGLHCIKNYFEIYRALLRHNKNAVEINYCHRGKSVIITIFKLISLSATIAIDLTIVRRLFEGKPELFPKHNVQTGVPVNRNDDYIMLISLCVN